MRTARVSLDVGEGRDAAELSYLGDGEDGIIQRNRKILGSFEEEKEVQLIFT